MICRVITLDPQTREATARIGVVIADATSKKTRERILIAVTANDFLKDIHAVVDLPDPGGVAVMEVYQATVNMECQKFNLSTVLFKEPALMKPIELTVQSQFRPPVGTEVEIRYVDLDEKLIIFPTIRRTVFGYNYEHLLIDGHVQHKLFGAPVFSDGKLVGIVGGSTKETTFVIPNDIIQCAVEETVQLNKYGKGIFCRHPRNPIYTKK